jgi:hypothetical protein
LKTILVSLFLLAGSLQAGSVSCAQNLIIVSNGAGVNGFFGCGPYTAPAGMAVESFSFTGQLAYANANPIPPVQMTLTLMPVGFAPFVVVANLPGGLTGQSDPFLLNSATFGLALPTLSFPVDYTVGFSGAPTPDFVALNLTMVTVDTPIGSSPSNPVFPTSGANGQWTFVNVFSARWFDPPLVDAFDYAGLNGTTFDGITLPPGFSNNFAVYDGATLLGYFAGGSSVDFLTLAGGPLGAFRIGGITPLVDAADAAAFPLQIFFSTPTGSFTQTAVVPEPSTWALVAGAGLLMLRRRAKQ